jgi:hypothetical protein
MDLYQRFDKEIGPGNVFPGSIEECMEGGTALLYRPGEVSV